MFTFFYKNLIRPLLFLVDPETVHEWVMGLAQALFKIPFKKQAITFLFKSSNQALSQEIMGLHFPNPVGLAAGFDKNARWIDTLSAFGFGFIEIGTITPKPQDGNPKPRLFRLPADRALINRMGFNNAGVEKAILNLKKRKSTIIVGGNIGKNKITSNEDAILDYLICFERLFDYVDYFVVNVSSPNTPNLRELQEKEPLNLLLKALQQKNKQHRNPKPILLKIAPDLTDSQLDDIIEITKETELTGIIATNTTVSRENLETTAQEIAEMGNGGLSGKPVAERSTEIIRYLRKSLPKPTVIIGVGGIFAAVDAQTKIDAGADLVQVYTGFIYEGIGIVQKINKGLRLS